MHYDMFYLILLCVLFILAISDLVVGVSNDAVNFLNSAIGSKAAPFYVVLIIASAGVILGATFSSGMMEVARSGIFNPSRFSFHEVMLIFLAVVVTDVVVLDLFNTFGLPTSTTVSMVFELLGASVAIALIKIYYTQGENFANLAGYINTSKASAIVFSILASVFIGFVVGTVVQFLARCLFTFKTKKTLKYFGSLWGGICIALIVYFIIFKGMKGSSLIPEYVITYLSLHTWQFMLITFAIASVLLQLIYSIFKYNPLKIIVLAGTFALAVAFAGNDLVNFIGVSMAGLSSYDIFTASPAGTSPFLLNMSALQGQESPTAMFILFLSGFVMTLTLWFSKKSKNVLQTTVKLSSQNSNEEERFASTSLSRSIVKMFVGLSDAGDKILPAKLKRTIARRFRPAKSTQDGEAFDLVRASVNLMVASGLIAFGTSLRLPLSTTYITFMVAMGSSLSDGAWGRENAVYRVTGVFTVIGGWFVTALVAFSIASVFAFILYFGGALAMVGILGLALYSIIRNRRKSKKNAGKEEQNATYLRGEIAPEGIAYAINKDIISFIETIPNLYDSVLSALDEESLKTLRKTQKDFQSLEVRSQIMKNKFNETIKLLQDQNVPGAAFYIQIVNYLREILHSTSFIIDGSYEHTDNKHKALLKEQIEELKEGGDTLHELFKHLIHIIDTEQYNQLEELNIEQQKIGLLFDGLNKKQMKRVKNGISGTKNSLLFLKITANAKNMALFTYLMAKSLRDFNTTQDSSSTLL